MEVNAIVPPGRTDTAGNWFFMHHPVEQGQAELCLMQFTSKRYEWPMHLAAEADPSIVYDVLLEMMKVAR